MITADWLKNILNKQTAHVDYLPKISHHVTPELISYEDGYLAWVIQVDGMPFESQNNSHIITHFEQLNNLLTAIGKTTGNRLALWTTLQRKKGSLKESTRLIIYSQMSFLVSMLRNLKKVVTLVITFT